MHLRPLLLSAVVMSACASQRPVTPSPGAPWEALAPASSGSATEYGTPHPFVLQASAPDGSWLVACQAREDSDQDGRVWVGFGHHGDIFGDAMRPYLFLDPGPGMPLDDALAADPAGRYLVLVRDGALRLLDTRERREALLAPSASVDADSPQPPRRASFSRDGRRLLYLRPDGQRNTLVLRDLEAGTERVLDTGKGLLGQAFLDPSGHWAVVDVVEEDTNGDGRLAWPQERTTLASALCRGPVMSSSHFGYEGDRPVRRYLPLEGGRARQGLDILRPLGAGLLRWEEDGALVLEDARGQRETWVPASCNARLLHADAERNQLVVACQVNEPTSPLELHGPGVHQPLGWRISASAEEPGTAARPLRLLSLDASSATRPAMGPVVLDLERRTVTELPQQEDVVTSRGPVLLTQETRKQEERTTRHLWLWNVDTGKKTEVGEAHVYSRSEAGDLILHMGWLVDLREGRVLGRVEDEPLAIDSQGRALRPSSSVTPEDPESRGGPPLEGPVRWEPAVKANTKPGT